MALQLLRGQLLQTCPLPTTDLSGRTYIVTGANSGLGLDAAKHIYRLKCSHLILACRDMTKGEKTRTEILVQTRSSDSKESVSQQEISVWPLDMASYDSVQAFANQASTLPALHGAILNAGVMLSDFSLCPATSLETTLTVNVTSTFLLAILLLPTLRRSSTPQPQSNTTSPPTPHLTIVGSAVHHFANHQPLLSALPPTTTTSKSNIKSPSKSNILTTLSDKNTTPSQMQDRYFLSKLLVMLLTVHMAEQMSAGANKTAPVILNCVSPGYCRTNLFRDEAANNAGARVGLRVIGRSSEEGSRTLVHGVAEAGSDSHGRYLSECRIKKVSKFVTSEEGRRVGALLWDEVKDIAEGVHGGCTSVI